MAAQNSYLTRQGREAAIGHSLWQAIPLRLVHELLQPARKLEAQLPDLAVFVDATGHVLQPVRKVHGCLKPWLPGPRLLFTPAQPTDGSLVKQNIPNVTRLRAGAMQRIGPSPSFEAVHPQRRLVVPCYVPPPAVLEAGATVR